MEKKSFVFDTLPTDPEKLRSRPEAELKDP